MIISHLAQRLVIFLPLLIPILAKLVEDLPVDTCVCAVEDAPMYKLAGFEHYIVQYMLANTCAFTSGDNTLQYGTYWYNLKIVNQVLWTSGDYLSKGETSNDTDTLTNICGLPGLLNG